jgi:hypothetical protein
MKVSKNIYCSPADFFVFSEELCGFFDLYRKVSNLAHKNALSYGSLGPSKKKVDNSKHRFGDHT